jgi:hypothetical protein
MKSKHGDILKLKYGCGMNDKGCWNAGKIKHKVRLGESLVLGMAVRGLDA